MIVWRQVRQFGKAGGGRKGGSGIAEARGTVGEMQANRSRMFGRVWMGQEVWRMSRHECKRKTESGSTRARAEKNAFEWKPPGERRKRRKCCATEERSVRGRQASGVRGG